MQKIENLATRAPADHDFYLIEYAQMMRRDVGLDEVATWTIYWGDGEFSTVYGATPVLTHIYSDNFDSYPISVLATDEDGTYISETKWVLVHGVAPTANFTLDAETAPEGGTITASFSGEFDPATDVINGLHYSFALTPASLATSYGGASTSPTAPIQFDDNGTYTIYGRIFDKDGFFTDYWAEVTFTNVAPTAELTTLGAAQGASVSATFGSAIDPSAVDMLLGLRYSLALDSNDLAESYEEASDMDSMDFLIGVAGEHTIFGRIFDKDGGYTDYQTTVVVENVAPTLSVGSDYNVTEGEELTFVASATDPGGEFDLLAFSLIDAPEGATIDPLTGEFSWTPTVGLEAAAYTFYVQVIDGNGASDVKTVMVTVNRAPVLAAIGSQSTQQGVELSFTASATDANPSSVLAFSLEGDYPAGASISSEGVFTWTPSSEQLPGDYTIRIVVTDELGLTDFEEIVVTVGPAE